MSCCGSLSIRGGGAFPDEGSEEVVGWGVSRVDADSLHSARKKDLVHVLHEPTELGIRQCRGTTQSWILIGLADEAPRAVPPHQVGPDDDAGEVVLEALGGVDAAHLP